MPYQASRDADGFYRIQGVPVFAEVPKGVKGAPFHVDQTWLQDAVANSKTRAREGYLAPLHFEHHDGQERSFKAGHYRLTRVGKVTIGGQKKFAIFADFLKMPGHVFDQIMANEWPFRSVEIASYAEREIESVALLDDDTPFHKFRLLNAESIEIDEEAAREPYPIGPVAFATSDRETPMALFHFGGEKTMRVKLGFDSESRMFKATGEDGKALTGDFADAIFDVALAGAFADDDDNLPKEEAELKKLQKRVSAALKRFESDDEDDDEAPAEGDDKGMKGGADLDKVKLFARIDALEADKKKRDKKDAAAEFAKTCREQVDEVVASLEGDTWHVSKETRAEFLKFAKAGALEDAVALYKRTTRRDGSETMEDDAPDAGPRFGDDDLVAQYAAQGDDAERTVHAQAAIFQQMVERGMKQPADRVAFLGRAMKSRGFVAIEAKAS